MTLPDPFGAVVTTIRADTAVAAIVGSKVSSQVNAGESPPLVVLAELATTRRPYGPGSGRLGMQLGTYVARCYAPDTPAGAIQARQLAGAVSDCLHGLHWKTASGKLIAEAYAPEIDGVTRDPDTRWPHSDVILNVYVATV